MIIGTLEIKLMVRESRSLKDKRRIIKSLKERLRNHFNVSVAEIGSLQNRQQCLLGVAAIGMETRFLNSVLSKVIDFVRTSRGAELIDYELDFL
jgi:uncharacterized protein YlxP (DUF503 family)